MSARRNRGEARCVRDGGFSLSEVLISVVMMAMISVSLVGVVAVVLRSTPSTEERADDARSTMGLVTWLPQDVDSTPPGGFNLDSAASSGCDLSPGTNLLRLKWSERTGSATTTYIADYRHVSQSGSHRIQRVTCSGIGAGPYAGATATNVTSDLPPLPAGWVQGSAPVAVTLSALDADAPRLVTFEITTTTGRVLKTDSAPKNPAMTLPSTTAPSWMPPTPATNVVENHPPTTEDVSIAVYPDIVTTIDLSVSDADGDTLVVELDPTSVPAGWTVTLASLRMSITPPAGAVGTTVPITYLVDDQRANGAVLAAVTVEVVPTTTATTPATSSTTTSTTAPPSCQVLTASLSPSTVRNVQPDSNNQASGNVNVGVLKTSVVVSATTNAYCDGLHLRYDSGGSNTQAFVNMTEVAENTWSALLPGRDQGSSETWSDGAHPISVHSADGEARRATLTLTVT